MRQFPGSECILCRREVCECGAYAQVMRVKEQELRESALFYLSLMPDELAEPLRKMWGIL